MPDLPGEPRDHMDALLGFLVPYARRQVAEYGGFLPFGASMAPDGELKTLTGDARSDASAQDQLEAMRVDAWAEADRGAVLAVGICSDVTLTAGGFPEGIRIELEHRDADPVTCLLPYRTGPNEPEFGDLVATPGERRIWG